MNPSPDSRPEPRVTFLRGQGGLPLLEITTPRSVAHIYLHGAHVTQFQRKNEPPLLFMSQRSRFEAAAPIRGGIPIIFPWFGKPADKPGQHGFARTRDWELKEINSCADGGVTVRLALPPSPELADGKISVDYAVTANADLTAELTVRNSTAREFTFENCLHTYLSVGDIAAVSLKGLNGAEYLDHLTNSSRHTDIGETIRVAAEVDRAYLNTAAAVEIADASLLRVIRVDKENSNSTVVWNPWIAKAKAMPDFGDEEYRTMICVESGNVAENKITLAAGKTSRLKVMLSSKALAA